MYFPSHPKEKEVETEGEKVCIATFSQKQGAFAGGRVGYRIGGRCVHARSTYIFAPYLFAPYLRPACTFLSTFV